MDFYCFVCENKFISEKDAITHLRKDHFLVDNVNPINCIVQNCAKTYNTFKGLKHHLKNSVHQTNREGLFENNGVASTAEKLNAFD